MFDNITESGCAGGIQFSLIDEWFKQTWITNPYSNAEYRHHWHNITAPEQNFGILSYAPPPEPFVETGSYPGKLHLRGKGGFRLYLFPHQASDED